MLEIKKISKIYTTESFDQKALDEVSISFRENEFVSILGPSGSGKTTLLNIIGGLDKYTAGDLIINGVSTKEYTDRDWDTYRNHKIGFVFQSYNLITHQSILSNVELALTLSGVSKKERRRKAEKALASVGLKEHMYKRPNQLSGGQMQRVAIARALVNNPDIVLADEPTGALDSKTSEQIMNLLKEVAKDRLVVMVTHNRELAETYSTRIIELKDGVVTNDTNPFTVDTKEAVKQKKDKRTNMSFKTALGLSLNNLMTKKGRTILTAFAGSIGIIGIALILSLSSGVQEYIDRVQKETLTSYPLTIEANSVDMTSIMTEAQERQKEAIEESKGSKKVYSNNTIGDMMSIFGSKIETNNIKDFKDYVEEKKVLDEYASEISYQYDLDLQIFKADTSDGVLQVHPDSVMESMGFGTDSRMMIGDVWTQMFENDDLNNQLYEVVAGRMPEKYNEVVLLMDSNNRVSDYVLYAIGLKDQEELEEMLQKIMKGEEVESKIESYTFDEILDLEFKFLLNSDYYKKVGNMWVDKREDEAYLKEKVDAAETLKVVGIIRPNENVTITTNSMGGILYTKELETYIINKANEAVIVKEQKDNPETNVITGLNFEDDDFSIEKLTPEQQAYLATLSPEEIADLVDMYREQSEATYETILRDLGAIDLENPSSIHIYAKDFESKDSIKDVITKYNEKQERNGHEENIINYSDLVGMLMSGITGIIDIVSYVLISFVSISLVVSSIMIGIITYISVLERTKEIGILRAIGASKKDVSRVFNAETLIVGFAAGLFGVLVTVLLNIPINMVIKALTGVSGISSLPIVGAVVLILISVFLTMIAGLIPARVASVKDPVEALRTE
ncbi:MAG: ABC transporter ATP-binding protein/permease [Mycoplasmatota bacterium]|nr:ABC transporter ATP-binding protein/permease [Mycoplasmatota bacterium]